MNKEQAQMALLMIKGLLSECEEKDRNEVEVAAQNIRDTIAQYGDNGRVAFSLDLTEMQAAGEFDK